jgi:hypothetical protein
MRRILGILLAFLALNAFGGGLYGMLGARGVPAEWLAGSPFRSYFLPSLFLFVVVGGVCALAGWAVLRGRSSAGILARAAAVLLLAWIAAQVAIIGYVSWLQPAVALSGCVVLLLATRLSRN